MVYLGSIPSILFSLPSVRLIHFRVWLFDDKFVNTRGTTYGFWIMGEITFLGAVFLSNMKVLTFSNSMSYAQAFAIIQSVISAILVWFWVSSFDTGVLEYSFLQIFRSYQVYFYFFVIAGFSLIDWAIHKTVGN